MFGKQIKGSQEWTGCPLICSPTASSSSQSCRDPSAGHRPSCPLCTVWPGPAKASKNHPQRFFEALGAPPWHWLISKWALWQWAYLSITTKGLPHPHPLVLRPPIPNQQISCPGLVSQGPLSPKNGPKFKFPGEEPRSTKASQPLLFGLSIWEVGAGQ